MMNTAFRGIHTWNVMIVDDHPIVRAGIVSVLTRDPEFTVCCEAGSEEEVVEKIPVCRPDLAIIDLSLIQFSGFLLFRKLLKHFPGVRILVLSMHDETVYAEKVLKAGGHGYLMKGEATDALIHAARTVLRGDFYVSDRMRNLMLQRVARGPNRQPTNGATDLLTPAEFAVLQLIAEGVTTQMIAKQLNRSIKTIDTHRANIKRKLELPNNEALLRYAIEYSRSH